MTMSTNDATTNQPPPEGEGSGGANTGGAPLEPAPPSAQSQPAPLVAESGGAALRRGLRYVGRHPLGVIVAATAVGALIEVELAVALGVAASVAVLFVTPSGTERRRALDRQVRRMGKGAVTAVREAFAPHPGAPPPKQ